VTGILEDLPVNTDRQEEIYLSYSNLRDYEPRVGWRQLGGVSGGMHCFILLKPDVALPTWTSRLVKCHRDTTLSTMRTCINLKLQHISDMHLQSRDLGGYIARKSLWAMSLIGLVLIITACLNFINLATAQAPDGRPRLEFAKVLGSQRGQLFWQFIDRNDLIAILALAFAFVFVELSLPYVNPAPGYSTSG